MTENEYVNSNIRKIKIKHWGIMITFFEKLDRKFDSICLMNVAYAGTFVTNCFSIDF